MANTSFYSVSRWALAVLVGLAGIGLNAVADAQILDYQSANRGGAHKTGAYEASGIGAGAFNIFPSIEVVGVYDDNIYAEKSGLQRGDELLVISPKVEAQSDWSRHELQLFAKGEFEIYDTYSSEDQQNAEVQGRFRLDVREATNVLIQTGYRLAHEERGAAEDVGGLTPSKYENFDSRLQFNQSFGDLKFALGGRYERLDYHDVAYVTGFINNDDRDRDIFTASAQVEYEFSPDYSVYVETDLNWRRFDDLVDDAGYDRNSDGYEINAGLKFKVTDLIDGYVFGGYQEQDPDDPRLVSFSGVSFGANLEWRPTALTTVGLRAERNVEDSFYPGASGFFGDRAVLRIDHALRRNLNVGVFGEIGQDKYKGIARTDFRYGGGVDIRWNFNRYLDARLSYHYSARNSDVPGVVDDFSANRVSIGLQAHY